MSDHAPLELYAYLLVVGLGALKFIPAAETTFKGIGFAGLKLLTLIVVMGVVTTVGIQARKKVQRRVYDAG